MQLFEGFIGEKGDPGVRDDPQDRGHEPPVKSLHTFLLGDPDEDVHDVAVPVRRWRESQSGLVACLCTLIKKGSSLVRMPPVWLHPLRDRKCRGNTVKVTGLPAHS